MQYVGFFDNIFFCYFLRFDFLISDIHDENDRYWCPKWNLYTLESNTQPNSDENDVDDKEIYNISDVNKNKNK